MLVPLVLPVAILLITILILFHYYITISTQGCVYMTLNHQTNTDRKWIFKLTGCLRENIFKVNKLFHLFIRCYI